MPERCSKRGCNAPDVLDVTGDAPSDRQFFALYIENFVHGEEKRGHWSFAAGLDCFPFRQDFVPEQGGKKLGEVGLPSRTRRSVFSSASITKRSPSGCSRMTSKERQQAVVQAFGAKLLYAFDGVAGRLAV